MHAALERLVQAYTVPTTRVEQPRQSGATGGNTRNSLVQSCGENGLVIDACIRSVVVQLKYAEVRQRLTCRLQNRDKISRELFEGFLDKKDAVNIVLGAPVEGAAGRGIRVVVQHRERVHCGREVGVYDHGRRSFSIEARGRLSSEHAGLRSDGSNASGAVARGAHARGHSANRLEGHEGIGTALAFGGIS